MRDYNTKKISDSNMVFRFNKAVKKGAYEALITDRVVFQRFLGHFEIMNGYRWHEVDEQDCFLCHDWSYCVYLYDRKIAANTDFYDSVEANKLGNATGQKTKSIFSPSYMTIESTQQVYPMIPI